MSEAFTGEIKMFAGNFAPRSYALCDGQLIGVSQNDALFSLLGTTYGGDGRTTFGLPDMRGRAPIHYGNGPGLTPRSWGAKFGGETATVTTQQLPGHTHAASGDNDTANSGAPAGKTLANASTPVYVPSGTSAMPPLGNTGGNTAHNNMMPFLAINFIICLFGIYPSRS